MAETKKDALVAFDVSVETWGVKYDEAVDCFIKDREALLAFYDFPAEHWKHLRTNNVVESSFATVRHRMVRSKGCLSNKTALARIVKLAEAAEKKLAPPRWPQPVAEGILHLPPNISWLIRRVDFFAWQNFCFGRSRSDAREPRRTQEWLSCLTRSGHSRLGGRLWPRPATQAVGWRGRFLG
jgi:hypothetical protein